MRRKLAEGQKDLADADLESLEVRLRVQYGPAARLRGVIFSMMAAKVSPALASEGGAIKFLGEWVARATPADFRLIANYLESVNGKPGFVDPVAARLIEYGQQLKQRGQTVREALALAPKSYLLGAMESRNIEADWNTVRKTLNRLGVQRSRGRKPKPRL